MPLWLIPLPYVAFGIIVGLVFPRIEYAYAPAFSHDVSVGSAQAYLSAVASGMITLTSIVFSVMFVMVQMTTAEYSKRLVMLFAGHPLGLHALGVFSATFMSALGTLQFVDWHQNGKVPALTVEFVTLLLLLSMVLLGLLIQRIALLRITYILQFVGNKGRSVIAEMLPPVSEQLTTEMRALRQEAEAVQRHAPVQRVLYDGVPLAIAKFRIDEYVKLAQSVGGTIVLYCAVGDTIAQGTELLAVYASNAEIPEASLLRGIVFSPERTFEQDPKYPLRLLVDTAIMALSPAVNDPTTAVQAIDQIQDLLNRLGRRVLDAGYVRDAQGALRLVYPMPTWEEYLALAFDEIRLYGATTLQVLRRMRSALLDLSGSLPDRERIASVGKYVDHLAAMVEQSDLDQIDRALALRADPQGLGHTRPPRV
jgi:uncharacterized membrane protein